MLSLVPMKALIEACAETSKALALIFGSIAYLLQLLWLPGAMLMPAADRTVLPVVIGLVCFAPFMAIPAHRKEATRFLIGGVALIMLTLSV